MSSGAYLQIGQWLVGERCILGLASLGSIQSQRTTAPIAVRRGCVSVLKYPGGLLLGVAFESHQISLVAIIENPETGFR